jgi:serine/threonine-protein kinase
MDISTGNKGVYAFGPFRLDPMRRVLLRDGDPVRLGSRLFDTLLYLVENPGRVIEKDELLTAVWGARIVEEANLSQAIFALRRALQTDESPDGLIVTAPGRGYRFVAPVSVDGGAPPAPSSSVAQPADRSGAPPRWRAPVAAAAAACLLIAAVGGAFAWRFWPGEPGQPAAAPFAPPPHSVAVLAFANMSGDPGQEYFSDGLAEEVINALSAVNQLHVAARVSAFSFKGSHATVADIARKLNVGAVLEGSVRRGGGRVRIAAAMIDARTGFQIWSRSVDRDEHDMLDLEREIATEVSTALQVTLAPADIARVTLGDTANPQAFDRFLRGMQLARAMQAGTLQKAVDMFDQAIALDPAYAHAYSARAVQLLNLAMTAPPGASAKDQAARNDAALASADKAIVLAPELAAAHAARAVILLNGYLRNDDAMAEAGRARALAPGDAAIVANYAQVAIAAGHAADAVDAARQATALDPLRPDVWLIDAYVLFMARQYDGVLVAAGHEKALRGTLPERSQLLVALSEYLQGNFAAAEQACPAVGADYVDECFALVDHATGRTDAAQTHLAHFRAQSGGANFDQRSEIAAQWGETAQALDLLQQGFAHDPASLSEIGTDPLLDPIRQEPRFQAVLRQVSKAQGK